MKTSLPPLIREGLDVVFVGTRPGLKSLEIGHYYADSTNTFYIDLHKTGFTPVRLRAPHDQELLSYGIGLDDVYDDAAGLRSRVEAVSPRCVCFNSKDALEQFVGSKLPARVWQGDGARRYAQLAPITWAVPDSSGLARRYYPARLECLRRLRLRIQDVRGSA